MHLPVTPVYTLPHSQGILNTTPSCFRVSTGSLGRTKCDLNVVSDLKTDHMTCCCRQRWRTAVDLNSGEGSLSDAYRFLEFVMLFRSIMTQNNLKTTVCHHKPQWQADGKDWQFRWHFSQQLRLMEQTRVCCLYPAEDCQTSQLLQYNVHYGQKNAAKNTAPSQMMVRHTPLFFLPPFLHPEVPRWPPGCVT